MSTSMEAAESKWKIHVSNSAVNFSVKLQPFFTVPGRFSVFSGSILFDPENPKDCQVEAMIKSSSIDTNNIERDDHLRSSDFFHTSAFPNLYFKSTHSEKIDQTHYRITGLLTIRDQEKEVILDAQYLGLVTDEQKRSIGWEATTEISRSEWGIDYGPNMISNRVTITIHAQAIEAKDSGKTTEIDK